MLRDASESISIRKSFNNQIKAEITNEIYKPPYASGITSPEIKRTSTVKKKKKKKRKPKPIDPDLEAQVLLLKQDHE